MIWKGIIFVFVKPTSVARRFYKLTNIIPFQIKWVVKPVSKFDFLYSIFIKCSNPVYFTSVKLQFRSKPNTPPPSHHSWAEVECPSDKKKVQRSLLCSEAIFYWDSLLCESCVNMSTWLILLTVDSLIALLDSFK